MQLTNTQIVSGLGILVGIVQWFNQLAPAAWEVTALGLAIVILEAIQQWEANQKQAAQANGN